MKTKITLLIISTFICVMSCNNEKNIIENSLQTAVIQYKAMDKTVPDSMLPRTTNPDGSLRLNKPDWWTSGFYPGSLWYLYEFSNDEVIKNIALKKLKTIEEQQFFTRDHDIGFQIMCSYGNALRITNDSSYVPVLINAAKSLKNVIFPSLSNFIAPRK